MYPFKNTPHNPMRICGVNKGDRKKIINYRPPLPNFLVSTLIKISLGFLNKSANPTKSVINPGVINKIPETTIKKPSPKAFKSFSGSCNESFLKWLRVLIPSFFIKILPLIAVKIMSEMVFKEPIYSLILMKKKISIIGIDKNNIKKTKIFLTSSFSCKPSIP